MSVLLETTLGDIVIDLFVTERSRSCQNFLKLCKMKYYNFCAFHFVKRNFIAQTGDPSGRGDGGESIFSHVYGPQVKKLLAAYDPGLKNVFILTMNFKLSYTAVKLKRTSVLLKATNKLGAFKLFHYQKK